MEFLDKMAPQPITFALNLWGFAHFTGWAQLPKLRICSNGNMKEFDYFAPITGNDWGMCLIEVLVSTSDSSPIIVMSQNDRNESAKRPHCSMVSGKVQCTDATWKMSAEGGNFSLIVDERDPCATAATPKPSCCDNSNTAKSIECKSSLLGAQDRFLLVHILLTLIMD